MAGAASFDYFFFLTRLTVALRDVVQPRRWGMQVTVTDDATVADNTTWVLVKGLASDDINDNNNWQTLADYAGGGGGGGGWDREAVDVSLANLALDMGGRQLREFLPSGVITAPKTWVVSNGGSAFEFRMIFEIDDVHVQTMPADFEMADPLFDSATKEWTPLDVGVYEAHAVYNGTTWYLTITGLFE